MIKLQKAILKTLAYADVFNYPLTLQEIDRWLIKLKTQNSKLKTTIQNAKLIQEKKGFYFLKGKEKLVGLREKRERWSKEKLKIAHRVARWLRLIPTIKMVGVSGALAMNNSDLNDDIDFLIVTRKNRLWLTRLFTVLLVELIANRRHPRDKNVKDKICLNMFLDEEHLEVPENEQDLFSAHEVCQLKPIWDRDDIYKRFLRENEWVKKYLPNGIDIKILRYEDIKGNKKRTLNFFENLAYQLQLAYMKSRRTTEVVKPHRIRFHPQDCRGWIMIEYQKRLKKLGIR